MRRSDISKKLTENLFHAFGDDMLVMQNNSPFSNSATKSMNEKQLAMEKIQPLIDAGLVVVRWNGEKEDPAVPGGPGN